MTAISKDIDKYISEVGTHLFCPKKKKREVLADIREAVFAFAEEFSVESIEDIYRRFGTPGEIAKAYLSDAEPANIKKAIDVRRVLVVAVVVIIAIVALSFLIAIIDNHLATITYYEETIFENVTMPGVG